MPKIHTAVWRENFYTPLLSSERVTYNARSGVWYFDGLRLTFGEKIRVYYMIWTKMNSYEILGAMMYSISLEITSWIWVSNFCWISSKWLCIIHLWSNVNSANNVRRTYSKFSQNGDSIDVWHVYMSFIQLKIKGWNLKFNICILQ